MRVELHTLPEPVADYQRLIDYARLAVKLDHPALVRVVDVAVDATGRPVLITSASNQPGAKLHQQTPHVSELTTACSIIMTLAEALHYLHGAHFRGGLSLSWTSSVRASSMDDGTWRVALFPPTPSQIDRAVTLAGFAGVVRLAAPELLGSGPAIPTPASDSFSLGALLFEILTGEPLIRSRAIGEMVRELRAGKFRQLSEVRGDVSVALSDFLVRALALLPESRQSLQDWGKAMRELGGRPLHQPSASSLDDLAVSATQQTTELRLESLTQESVRELLFRISTPPVTGGYGGLSAILSVDEGLESARSPFDESVAFGPTSRGLEIEEPSPEPVPRLESPPPATTIPADIAAVAQPRPAPAAHVDPVDCTVFAPPAAAVGESFLVQLFAHTPQQTDDAIAMAHDFDETARRLGFTSLDLEIPRESKLQVELTLPGLEIDESVQSFVWRGRAVSVQFAVNVPPPQKLGNLIGKVTVYYDGTPVGHVRFKIEITAARPVLVGSAASGGPPSTGPLPLVGSGVVKPEAQPLGDEAIRYKQVFVSYAMKDLSEVIKRVQMLKSLRVNYFQDLLDLEPGERWERKLYQHIDSCDVFMLFWSTASKESKWVTKEVQYALDRKGGDDSRPPEILPIMIEGPPVPLPNPELAHLHFNEKLLYYMKPVTGDRPVAS